MRCSVLASILDMGQVCSIKCLNKLCPFSLLCCSCVTLFNLFCLMIDWCLGIIIDIRDIVDSNKIECQLSTTLVLVVFSRSILGKYKRH